MAGSSLQFLALSFLTLFSGCLAVQRGQQFQQGMGQCSLTNLNPLEPMRRLEYEGGYSEFWDSNNEQLRCAGVAVTRHVIGSRGLLLPSFNNAPTMVFVIQGNGILGVMDPGCPETYQSVGQIQGQQSEQGQQRFRDQHQKIHQLYRGDVIALPTGVAHWCHNEGNQDLVLVVVHHTANLENQLDENLRRFFIAGNPQQQQRQGTYQGQQQPGQQRHQGVNIFQAFDAQILAQAFQVDQETVRKLQNENDNRGSIIRVRDEFRIVSPRREQQFQEQQQGGGYYMNEKANGFEETICSLRFRENLANPERADIYTANGGSIAALNSLNLPILRVLRLSAGRGLLRPAAMVAPHWNINAHSISYIARGNARVQIVGNSNRPVFDGEVREGQLLIVPQNFAHFKQAGNQGCEWFTVKTNDQARTSPLVGKTSVIRAMPEEVLINAYQLSREEARRIKYNRQEVTILSPQYSESQQRGVEIPMSVV
ncbi:OLC1v1026521C2 [Oldenlandia corymbosa var. corymbosa]|uniref:OLC1v1026521C2 n=1 Tax=Oldenlandia corymbosa var. corymbosa TaxID=529605 RepID=A0AAV1C776_OLDCO|nr:OLC1v1026521C2 [Oldenlandia corymbosa var. corymbosa]